MLNEEIKKQFWEALGVEREEAEYYPPYLTLDQRDKFEERLNNKLSYTDRILGFKPGLDRWQYMILFKKDHGIYYVENFYTAKTRNLALMSLITQLLNTGILTVEEGRKALGYQEGANNDDE